jgi:hypothetical protein
MGFSKLIRCTGLCLIVLAALLPAQRPASLMSTVNADPLATQNVFATEPPVLQSDLLFEKNNLGQLGTACYGTAATSTSHTCYTSSMPGSQTILSQSANQTFTLMILTATFAGAPTSMSGASALVVPINGSAFSLLGGQAANTSGPAMISQFNNGDFSSIFVRMSDYFGGLSCGSNPGGNTCLIKTNANPVIPYSFVNLPANVIFSSSGTNAVAEGFETDPSTSTSGILATLVSNPGGTVAPEPVTLLLVGGGVLAMLRLRSRANRRSATSNNL